LDEIASDFVEMGVVENVGVAVGISSIAHPISKMQSTSGLVSAMLIYCSRSCWTMSPVALVNWAWWKMWE
jgi:hypothetical protein